MTRIPFHYSSRIWMLCVVFVLTSGLLANAEEEVRTWTDASGKYKIEARYIGTKGTKVTLEQPNGKKIEIELKQFSADDQKRIESLDANPFKPAKEEGSEEPRRMPSRRRFPSTGPAPKRSVGEPGR